MKYTFTDQCRLALHDCSELCAWFAVLFMLAVVLIGGAASLHYIVTHIGDL